MFTFVDTISRFRPLHVRMRRVGVRLPWGQGYGIRLIHRGGDSLIDRGGKALGLFVAAQQDREAAELFPQGSEAGSMPKLGGGVGDVAGADGGGGQQCRQDDFEYVGGGKSGSVLLAGLQVA